MKRACVAATLMLLFTALSLPAFAQEGQGYEIGAFASWADWRERQFQIGFPQAIPPIDVDFDYNDEIVGGVRFNFLSRRHWGGELSYSYQQNTVSIVSTPGTPVHMDGAVHHAFYNHIFYPVKYETGPVKPYLTGGIGLAGYTLNLAGRSKAAEAGLGTFSKIDNRFAVNYGAGIKAEISRSVGVRFDFRHHFSEVPTYGVPKEPGQGSSLPFDGKLQTLEMSFGIYYHTVR